jgi:hypothetical protein
MMRFWSALLLAMALLSVPAAAGSWPTPNAAYQGTRVMNAEGMQMSGRLFHDHGKERWEVNMEGMTQVMIMRPDLEKMFMFMPEMNMAMEMPLTFGGNVPSPDRYAGSEPEVVGQEVIAGEQTTKYKVEGDEGTGPYMVFFWMTEDGITMRTEGSSAEGSFEMYLDGLQRGAQPAALFEVPAGVQLMPANPAMMNQMMQGQGQ